MAVWTIDGTVVEVDAARARWGQTLYKNVTIRKADGSEERIGKFAAAGQVQDMVAEGTTGRFYLFKNVGQRGFCGFRGNGEEIYAYPKFFFWMQLVMMFLMAGLIAFSWGSWYEIRFAIAVLVLVASAVFVAFDLNSQSAAAGYFSRDSRNGPPAA